MNAAGSTGGTELPPRESTPNRRPFGCFLRCCVGFLVFLFIAFVGMIEPGIPPWHAWNAIAGEHVQLITRSLLAYAQDHQGKFPPGKSSTEVFQALLDGGYATYFENRPALFYFPVKGKTPGENGQPLKPENVCFDVTSPTDSSDPADLPLVFSTGFKVSYEPGAVAVRLTVPDFRIPGFDLFRSDPGPQHDCINVGDRRSTVRTLIVEDDPKTVHGSARGFVPAGFKSNGKVYQQLTPDGSLP